MRNAAIETTLTDAGIRQCLRVVLKYPIVVVEIDDQIGRLRVSSNISAHIREPP
jgi:hypothetical protein